MEPYISTARQNIEVVTNELLKDNGTVRISINGIGDHCDGKDWLQMYALSSKPEEVQGAIKSIVMTNGGDEPEAYECLALALTQRLQKDSAGRKRAVVLVGDSVPHGMQDAECPHAQSYERAFTAIKTLCDGFYLVGCNPQTYSLQRKLIDSSRKAQEMFIPLGDMTHILAPLLVALAKKTESEKALVDYLSQLGLKDSLAAAQVRGLLAGGK